MNLLNKLTVLLLLTGFLSPVFAAVDSVEFTECAVYSDGDKDKKEGDKKAEEEEEEPDCE